MAKITPPQAELIAQFSLDDFGGHPQWLEDVNGDGALELLTLQTAGQLASDFYSPERRARLGIEDDDRSLFCLTALTLDGEKLWQVGTPWPHADKPFVSHGGGSSVRVGDINGDGKPEVVTVHRGHLRVLDGATGAQLAAVDAPSDNFIQLTLAQLSSPGTTSGGQVICKVNDGAYEPWEYSNPIIVYNADLSVYREPFAVKGAGHNVVPVDVNNDGRDELLIGYSLLDANCETIWSIDMGAGFDYARDHVDEIALTDVDGKTEIRYAGSEDLYFADLDGNLIRTTPAGHSQNTISGPWGPGGERVIILNEKNLGQRGLSAAGEQIWHRTDINGYAMAAATWLGEGARREWAVFRPQPKPVKPDAVPLISDPSISRSLWPKFIDGDGQLIEVFPWDDRYAQRARTIRAPRLYDAGVAYFPLVRDIDGDGLDEVLVSDRERVWVFRSPDASR